MELAKGMIIPIEADNVLSPDVLYSDNCTGIYFQTEDEKFGRITFENLDAIKICRGEILPYADDWEVEQKLTWVYKVEKSKWLTERFNYENENYGSSYEFGGKLHEMLTDFSHYVFRFHDEFVEVISRGFWFEKSDNSLIKQSLQSGHPFLPLPEIEVQEFVTSGIKYKAIFNTISVEQLIENSKFCQQKLVEITIEFEGEYTVSRKLTIMQRQGNLVSVLRQSLGKPVFEKNGLAPFADIKALVENEISEIAKRRKQLRK